MNIYSQKDEFIIDLCEWCKNNPIEIPKDAAEFNSQKGSLNGFYGKKHTDATKKLMKLKTGWKHSQSAKDKIREARIGVKRPASVGEKISNSISGVNHHMWGKKCSEETKKKISDTKKNNPYKHDEERRRKISEAAKLREMKKKKCLI